MDTTSPPDPPIPPGAVSLPRDTTGAVSLSRDTTGAIAPPDAAGPRAAAAHRRRPPPSRLSPTVLAEARLHGGAREGLSWLGREPEARASLLYRAIRLLARFILFGLFRFRVTTSGQELLPHGGYLLVGAAHRGWMDPFVVINA